MLDDGLRYQMARIALHGEEGIIASNYELHLPTPSYTWNTLQRLKEDFPNDTFKLLIGGDNWALFPRWYRAEDIVREHRIIVYPRRGSAIDREQLPANVQVVETPLLDISSTEIRERVKAGKSIRGMVPRQIEGLIRREYS